MPVKAPGVACGGGELEGIAVCVRRRMLGGPLERAGRWNGLAAGTGRPLERAGRGSPARRQRLRIAGGPVHHPAQRQHHSAESAACGPLHAGALLRDLRWHGRDRWPWRGGPVRGRKRPCGGRARIRVGRSWLGHGVFPWQVGTAAASSAATGLAADRNAATENGERAGANRRPARPASAADGHGLGPPLSSWPGNLHRAPARSACSDSSVRVATVDLGMLLERLMPG
jgi:hypothetical protein